MSRRVRMTLARLKTQMDRRFTRVDRAMRVHVAETTGLETGLGTVARRIESVGDKLDAIANMKGASETLNGRPAPERFRLSPARPEPVAAALVAYRESARDASTHQSI